MTLYKSVFVKFNNVSSFFYDCVNPMKATGACDFMVSKLTAQVHSHGRFNCCGCYMTAELF